MHVARDTQETEEYNRNGQECSENTVQPTFANHWQPAAKIRLCRCPITTLRW